jgi:hypothetical protein
LAKGEKKFFQKNGIFTDLENFAKNHFSEKKIFGNFLTQEFYTFLKSAQNSASFDTLHAQFEEIFFQLLYGTVEVKISNKIEIDQYFEKRFL